MSDQPSKKTTHDFEILVSTILRVGVITSLSVIILGTAITFLRHPDYTTSTPELTRLTHVGAVFPHKISQILHGLEKFEGRSIVEAGLLLLIATPVLRVAVSIFAFKQQKDRTFVVITTIVLLLLLLSFVLGRAES